MFLTQYNHISANFYQGWEQTSAAMQVAQLANRDADEITIDVGMT